MTSDSDSAAKPQVWLLSAYRTDSHARWADWIVRTNPQIGWHRMELPGRRFRWRIRGNPLSWLNKFPDSVPDLILATSMVDLATIRGLNPRLAHVPAWYYFHENQFAYPLSEHQYNQIDPQMVQLYGGLAAQRIFFNSEFNRSSFLEGVFELLRTKPQVDTSGICRQLEQKSGVLPIPIDPVEPASEKDERLIVWNHRWEYDKAPEVFADAMIRLANKGVDFRLALLGDRSEAMPNEALLRIREKLPGRIVADGRAGSRAYRQMLGRASIVVSTALHEFQGLAMLEAVSAGARPLVPDALCYPEQYPEACRYPPGDRVTIVKRLGKWLGSSGLPSPVDVTKWYSPQLISQWSDLWESLGEESGK